MHIVGYLGLLCAVTLAWPQLIFMLRHPQARLSITTCVLVLVMQVLFLLHAISIRDRVFIVSNAVNLFPNAAILWLAVKRN